MTRGEKVIAFIHRYCTVAHLAPRPVVIYKAG